LRSQIGAPAEQSLSLEHPAEHAPPGLQNGVPGSIAAHSRLLEQGSQEPEVPQTGAFASIARHSASLAQGSHEPDASQIGESASMLAHWALPEQASHEPDASQIGASASMPAHWPSLEHASHRLVPVLQAGVSPEQSVSAVHPAMQAPEGAQIPVAGLMAAH
jgi:hypothetical protein